MIMRDNKGFFSFAFDSVHVKYLPDDSLVLLSETTTFFGSLVT